MYDASKNKSYFNITHDELQKIIDERHATGQIRITASGQIKESIVAPNIIGVQVNKIVDKEQPTDRLTIHYSKSMTHAVPSRKDDK